MSAECLGGNLDLKKKGLRPPHAIYLYVRLQWEPRPEEEGIKTNERIHVRADLNSGNLDLKKKGLRP